MTDICEKKILVLATMSAGKSTLLNALIGDDVLPSSNEACTANIIRYTGNNMIDRVCYKEIAKQYSRETLIELNANIGGDDINLMGPIRSSMLNGLTVQFIDTPGVNNSQDEKHGMLTYQMLESGEFDEILYVLNATQLGINDDALLLAKVRAHLKKYPKRNVIFVLNKIDQIDFEKESLDDVLQNAICYIKNNTGIKNPNVIGVSAFFASLLWKQINDRKLTRKECLELDGFLSDIKDFRLSYGGCHNLKFLESNEIENDKVSYLPQTGLINLEKVLYTINKTEKHLKKNKLKSDLISKRLEIAVISSKGTGKSTLLNALAGDEIIRETMGKGLLKLQHVRNQKEVYVEAYDENQVKLRASKLESYPFHLDEDNVHSWVFKYHLPSFKSDLKKVSLTEISSDNVEENLITQYVKQGFIIYMLDGTIGIKIEDLELLGCVKDIVEKQGFILNEKVVFLLNKMDCLNDVQTVMETCLWQLREIGYENIILYPISSQLGVLVRRYLDGKLLNMKDQQVLWDKLNNLKVDNFYSKFVNEKMIKISYNDPLKPQSDCTSLLGLRWAMHYTGISILETVIKSRLK